MESKRSRPWHIRLRPKSPVMVTFVFTATGCAVATTGTSELPVAIVKLGKTLSTLAFDELNANTVFEAAVVWSLRAPVKVVPPMTLVVANTNCEY